MMKHLTSSEFEIIQATVIKSNNTLSVKELCKIAGVSRSGYYNWLASENVRESKELADARDFEIILGAYKYRGYDKGVRGIYMRLIHQDPPVVMNKKKITRLMHKYDLKCPIRRANPFRRAAKAIEQGSVAPNLLRREFREHGIRAVLLTDITYIIVKEIRCYLVTIIDAYTKEVLSYAMSKSFAVDFVLEATNKLMADYGHELPKDKKVLINSDQGSHYKSTCFIKLTNDYDFRQSMSRKANCWDNAPQESFFGHMKDSIGKKLKACETYEEIKEVIDDYMDYYNNDRYQWDLAKLSPREYAQFTRTKIYPLQGVIGEAKEAPIVKKEHKDAEKENGIRS